MTLTFLPTDPSWDLRIFFIMLPAASSSSWEMKQSWKVFVISEPPSLFPPFLPTAWIQAIPLSRLACPGAEASN